MEKFPSLNDKLDAGVMRKAEYGPISLDLSSKKLLGEAGQEEQLTDQEYQILWLLVRAQGKLLSETEISNFLYEDLPDHKDFPMSNGVETRLVKLRAKLERVSDDRVKIVNRRGFGYYLEISS